jgi:hypothetical protein
VRSWPIGALLMKVSARRNGSGNIFFLKSPEITAPSLGEIDLLPDGFFGVPRVRDLEELIPELRHAAQKGPTGPT